MKVVTKNINSKESENTINKITDGNMPAAKKSSFIECA